MKILKRGKKQSDWARPFICTGAGNHGGGCGATLQVEQGDLYVTESHCRDETDYYVTFSCPICKVETDLSSDIQLPFRSELPKKSTWIRKKDPEKR